MERSRGRRTTSPSPTSEEVLTPDRVASVLSRIANKAVATCGDPEHVTEAVLYMSGLVVRVRQISAGDERFKCRCGLGAVFFLSEVRS